SRPAGGGDTGRAPPRRVPDRTARPSLPVEPARVRDHPGARAVHRETTMATVRIGTFNVENLFERPRAMAGPLTGGNAVLAAHARVNDLLAEEAYGPEVRAEVLEHLGTLGLLRS